MATGSEADHPRKRFWMRLLVTAGGLGYAPVAPGTFGALWAIPIFLLCLSFRPSGYLAFWLPLLGFTVFVCVLTVATGRIQEAIFQQKDPKNAVLDEVAGLLATYLLFHRGDLWQVLLWGFLVTRACDILKIPPARQLEHLPGGWGILLDDLVSAIYAAAILHAGAMVCGWLGWSLIFNVS